MSVAPIFYVNEIPMTANFADNLSYRWKQLVLYKHNKNIELDRFEKTGELSEITFKKVKSKNYDVVFDYLNKRIDRAQAIIEKEIKPKMFGFYKGLN